MVVGTVWDIEVGIAEGIVGGIANLEGSGNICAILRFSL